MRSQPMVTSTHTPFLPFWPLSLGLFVDSESVLFFMVPNEVNGKPFRKAELEAMNQWTKQVGFLGSAIFTASTINLPLSGTWKKPPVFHALMPNTWWSGTTCPSMFLSMDLLLSQDLSVPPSHLMDELLPMLLHPRTQFILCVAQAVPWWFHRTGCWDVGVGFMKGLGKRADVKLESTAIWQRLAETSPANHCQSVWPFLIWSNVWVGHRRTWAVWNAGRKLRSCHERCLEPYSFRLTSDL